MVGSVVGKGLAVESFLARGLEWQSWFVLETDFDDYFGLLHPYHQFERTFFGKGLVWANFDEIWSSSIRGRIRAVWKSVNLGSKFKKKIDLDRKKFEN